MLEIITNSMGVILDVFLLIYFMKKYKFKYNMWFTVGFCLFYIIVVINVNHFAPNSEIRIPLYCILIGIFIYKFYDGITVIEAIKCLAAYFVLMEISELMLLFALTLIQSDQFVYYIINEPKLIIFTIFMTKMLNFVIIIIWNRFCKKKDIKYSVLSSIMIIIPLIICIGAMILSVNTIINYGSTNNKEFVSTLIIYILIIFAAMSYIVFFDYYEEFKQKEKFYEHLEEQNKQQYILFQEKMYNDQRIRKMYHDMKSHTSYLKYCLEKKMELDGIQYASHLLDELESYDTIYHTNNGMLDCLLNETRKKCDEKGIPFEVDVDFTNGQFICDFDICTLFGNILDNAYEASLKLDSYTNKPIELKMCTIDRYLVIRTTNYMVNETLDLRNFKTTKKDKENHGLGLKNIDDVLNKYDGTKKASVQEGKFIITIMIPIKE